MKRISLLLVIVACASSCLARSRFNSSCDWAPEEQAHLDLRRLNDRVHLIEDVDVAEENGIRYGDFFRRRRGQGEETRQRDQCTSALMAAIAQTHHISLEQVERARGQRLWYVDLLVALSFGAVYYVASSRVVAGLYERISVDDRIAAVGALSIAAALLSAIGLIALNIFGTAIEIVRHGDMHGSYRVSRGLPWSTHWLAVIGAGFLLVVQIGVAHLLGRRREVTT